jgi:hypothetical protein
MMYFCANVAEPNTLGKIIFCRNPRDMQTEPLNERFENIGTYEVIR